MGKDSHKLILIILKVRFLYLKMINKSLMNYKVNKR